MGSICLSLTPILRCSSLTRTQSIVLLVPTALQVVFAIGLLVCKWGSGRKHYFLVTEGFATFVLALLDFLSHILPLARNGYKTFDISIGVISFIPILLYIAYLYLMARSNLLPSLPRRFQSIITYILLVLIPVAVAMNEIGSFAGISYRNVLNTQTGEELLAVGFMSNAKQSLWLFFSSLSLALFTAFQAITFCLTFYKLVQAFINQRRIDTSSNEDTEAHLVRGLGWIAGGIKLGAIETVIGFTGVGGGFGTILARRLLRMISRACVIIGIVKGMDSVESFNLLDPSDRGNRRMGSTRRIKISAPQTNTFARLSQQATAFYNLPRARAAANNGNSNLAPPRSEKRVTVRYDGKAAPTLEMRLSDLGMPTPSMIKEYVERESMENAASERMAQTIPGTPSSWSLVSVPERAVAPPPRRPSPTADIGRERVTTTADAQDPFANPSPPERPRLLIPPRASGNSSYRQQLARSSVNSITSDSLSVVREIAAQFPGLPPRVTGRYRGSQLGQMREEGDRTDSVVDPNRPMPWASTVTGPDGSGTKRNDANADGSVSRSSTGNSQRSSESRKSSVLKRKAVPMPEPIDSDIARPEINPRATVMSGGTSAYPSPVSNAPRSRYPVAETLVALNTGNTLMSRRTMASSVYTTASAEGAAGADPFWYDIENETAVIEPVYREKGLGRLAVRVTQMERNREESDAAAAAAAAAAPYANRAGADTGRNARGLPGSPRPSQRMVPLPRQPDVPSTPPPPSPHDSLIVPLPRQRSALAAAEAAWLKSGSVAPSALSPTSLIPTRIKSVGSVVARQTPTPTHIRFNPESVSLERHQFEYHPDMKDSELSAGGRPRHDSDTLGVR
ncbi:hypothetical protein BD410DRAFT_893961 [Rickenella mellea]|uniref:Uncharacterized protein n=1 Tax=Rickenella mellea TaxID=50990 RepID=A0A4Y7QK88_9AGAM|nr:hypothetical protein BD410DRAFT_893961 [Rickenella mellea]